MRARATSSSSSSASSSALALCSALPHALFFLAGKPVGMSITSRTTAATVVAPPCAVARALTPDPTPWSTRMLRGRTFTPRYSGPLCPGGLHAPARVASCMPVFVAPLAAAHPPVTTRCTTQVILSNRELFAFCVTCTRSWCSIQSSLRTAPSLSRKPPPPIPRQCGGAFGETSFTVRVGSFRKLSASGSLRPSPIARNFSVRGPRESP